MNKTIFSKTDNLRMVERISKVTPFSTCVWGNMSPATMLYHCNITNNAILGARPSGKKRTLKQVLLKHLILNIKKEIPRGIKGNPKFFPTENSNLLFEEERRNWIQIICKFLNIQHQLEGDHPVFGTLDTKEWGRFVWLHMDHHLRQFGV